MWLRTTARHAPATTEARKDLKYGRGGPKHSPRRVNPKAPQAARNDTRVHPENARISIIQVERPTAVTSEAAVDVISVGYADVDSELKLFDGNFNLKSHELSDTSEIDEDDASRTTNDLVSKSFPANAANDLKQARQPVGTRFAAHAFVVLVTAVLASLLYRVSLPMLGAVPLLAYNPLHPRPSNPLTPLHSPGSPPHTPHTYVVPPASKAGTAAALPQGAPDTASSGGGGWQPSASTRVLLVVPHAAASPLKQSVPWGEVAEHLSRRLSWTDPSMQMRVFDEGVLGEQGPAGEAARQDFMQAAGEGCQLLVGLSLHSPALAAALQQHRAALPPLRVFLDSGAELAALTELAGFKPGQPLNWFESLTSLSSSTPAARGGRVMTVLHQLMTRHTSDDMLFVFLVLINEYITDVPQVSQTTKGFDLGGIVCMVRYCGANVMNCVTDRECKGALDCLQACEFNDQVCQYRCIVSHESPLLASFTLCILQLHNCRNLKAEVPMRPDPAPLASFRGAPLTHTAAEDMFVGWLGSGGSRHSWLVAGGKNPAYDYFPCQHQVYYRGRAQGTLWYEPVFKVITLDGRAVWRSRKYRVRRGQVPGTFHLSALDNGVTSNEFWRVLDCADDLSFCLFYYSGAASAAGLSYSGAVLATPDGSWPAPSHTARLEAALERAGIKPWEVSRVDNNDCADAPLHITGAAAAAAAA